MFKGALAHSSVSRKAHSLQVLGGSLLFFVLVNNFIRSLTS